MLEPLCHPLQLAQLYVVSVVLPPPSLPPLLLHPLKSLLLLEQTGMMLTEEIECRAVKR